MHFTAMSRFYPLLDRLVVVDKVIAGSYFSLTFVEMLHACNNYGYNVLSNCARHLLIAYLIHTAFQI